MEDCGFFFFDLGILIFGFLGFSVFFFFYLGFECVSNLKGLYVCVCLWICGMGGGIYI